MFVGFLGGVLFVLGGPITSVQGLFLVLHAGITPGGHRGP